MDEQQLRRVFEMCDVGWLFADGESGRAQRILGEMHDVDQIFDAKFGRPLGPALENVILADVSRFKPLVQTFASPMTASIRTMVYCVLDGAQITAVRFEYHLRQQSRLEVEVAYDSGDKATFSSDDLWDAEALRHFGLMKMGQAPVIDGYYGFRKGDSGAA